MRRSGDNALYPATSETWLLFDKGNFDFFPFEGKWDEDTFAASAIIGGKPPKAVAAVNQLFNFDLHLRILRFARCHWS